MKKNRFFTFLIGCVAALGLASCNSDHPGDTYVPPTKPEILAGYTRLKSLHNGILISTKNDGQSGRQLRDTVKVTWDFQNDSVLVFHNVPSKILATHVGNADLKDALSTQPAQDIKCLYKFYTVDPILIFIYPMPVEYNSLTYGGTTHKVKLMFYLDSNFSFGEIDRKTQKLWMQLVVAGIQTDKDTPQTNKEPKGLVFVSDGTVSPSPLQPAS